MQGVRLGWKLLAGGASQWNLCWSHASSGVSAPSSGVNMKSRWIDVEISDGSLEIFQTRRQVVAAMYYEQTIHASCMLTIERQRPLPPPLRLSLFLSISVLSLCLSRSLLWCRLFCLFFCSRSFCLGQERDEWVAELRVASRVVPLEENFELKALLRKGAFASVSDFFFLLSER